MRDRFTHIYATNEWGGGSGEGSAPEHTRGYVRFLQRFLRSHDVSRCVDLGCGDWQSSRFVDWVGIDYQGLDIVPSVVHELKVQYSRPGIRFDLFGTRWSELPVADLLIVKDVFQHWSNETISAFLPTLDRYRFCLITNCVDPRSTLTTNTDCPDGGFRYLDISLEPFCVEAETVYTFTNRRSFVQRLYTPPKWRKKVLLIRPKAASGHSG